MSKSTCAVADCGKIVDARGYCASHYRRFRAYGKADVPLQRQSGRQCSLDGCDRPHESQGFCSLHVSRLRKNGDPGPVGRINQKYPDSCQAEGCKRSPKTGSKGWCGTHYSRLRRTGSVDTRGISGHDAPNWRGEDISYRAAHKRIATARGAASQHNCVDDCGQTATHWSYDYSDPNEKTDSNTGYVYSLDPERYFPRCGSCHKKFDCARRDEHGQLRLL